MIEDATIEDLTVEDEDTLEENSLQYTCKDCKFVTKSKTSINNHVKDNHTQDENEEVKFICIVCGYEFTVAEDYDSHVKTHETANEDEVKEQMELENIVFNHIIETYIATEITDLKCDMCEHLADAKTSLMVHVQTKHETEQTCPESDYNSNQEKKIKTHDADGHTSANYQSCQDCAYVCTKKGEMDTHIQMMHKDEFAYGCDLCGFADDFVGNIWRHKFSKHTETFNFKTTNEVSSNDVLFNLLAEQNTNLKEEVTTLRDFIKESLKVLTENFTEIILDMKNAGERQHQETRDTLSNILKNQSQKKLDSITPKSNTATTKFSHNEADTMKTTAEKKENNIIKKQNNKTKYQQKPKVLVVGDSLAYTANFRRIEVVTNTTIKTAKAYISVWDDAVKSKAKNIADVTEKELKNAPFDHVVLAAPTVDITNIDTTKKKTDDDEVFKNKVVASCENMMRIAENVLDNDQNVQKVTLMNHGPRFDTVNVDPFRLKPKLANFANNYLLELWIDSPHKERIHVGNHSLDGLHMYGIQGKVAYTESVLDILLTSFQTPTQAQEHTSCPQAIIAKNQRLYSSVLKGNPGIKTQNRFSALTKNVGN